ncbi:hypothetical protein SDC9_131204 [bioreactor metagenome]|uniref:Uncharacterized protein n=1 Tax=bioreactor metagenome TaxID=1076179 RepID=A0A645D591_9ZZZZ
MEWVKWAEEIALGPLKLLPEQFEKLQPDEFLKMWNGYKWRQEQEENRMAYFTAAAMSVHTKKPVSPKDLLKPLRQVKKRPVNRKEEEKYLREKFGLSGGE